MKDGEKEHTTVSFSVRRDVYIKRNKQSPDGSSKNELGVYYEEKLYKVRIGCVGRWTVSFLSWKASCDSMISWPVSGSEAGTCSSAA